MSTGALPVGIRAHLLPDDSADNTIRDQDGFTPLMRFLKEGSDEGRIRAEILLRRGADPNATAFYGQTALTQAIRAGSRQSVCLLLHYGASPNVPDATGSTSLHVAIRDGASWAARVLLEHGAQPLLRTIHGRDSAYDLAKARVDNVYGNPIIDLPQSFVWCRCLVFCWESKDKAISSIPLSVLITWLVPAVQRAGLPAQCKKRAVDEIDDDARPKKQLRVCNAEEC